MRILRAIRRQVLQGAVTDPLDALQAINDHRRNVQQAATALHQRLLPTRPRLHPYPAHNRLVQADWLDKHIEELEHA